MLRQWRLSLSLTPVLAALAIAQTPPLARADAPRPGAAEPGPAAASSALTARPKPDDDLSNGPGFGDLSKNAPATIAVHAYTLTECLALADRNFPNLWAARARLAYTHAQLEEARWTPWFQWSAQSSFGVAPSLQGSVLYPQANLQQRNITTLGNLQPFVGYGISGVVPIYTFGKIETAREAAYNETRSIPFP